MELKRIIARDSRSANEKAIQLYGPDVLIISSQRVDSQTELVVAIDVAPLSVAEMSAQERQEPIADRPDNVKPRADAADFVPFAQIFQGAQASTTAAHADDALLAEPAASVLMKKRTNPEVQPQVATPAPAVSASQPAAPVVAEAPVASHEMQRSHEIVELLRQEMAALRKEFALSRQMMTWQDSLNLAPEIKQLSASLMESGMPAGLRGLLTDSIQHMDSAQEALPVVQRLLVDALARPDMAMPESGVHALCGPSGSGKTSMVARLAYAAAQQHGADQQVMISFADQRPGAWAQLQLLAAQAGVACYRAADSAMLQVLLDDLSGKTIWIDTSGTDFAGQAEVLRSQHPQVQLHAVLPVDATVTNVQKILQHPMFPWASLMLSKVDEAAMPWALVKGLSEHALPVSCVAGSSRISQAPEAFDASRLVGLALEPVLQIPAQVQVQPMVSVLPETAPVAAKPGVRVPSASGREATVSMPTMAARIVANSTKKHRKSSPKAGGVTAFATPVVPLRPSTDILMTAATATSLDTFRANVRAPLKVVHG